jgi:hypothetical protein
MTNVIANNIVTVKDGENIEAGDSVFALNVSGILTAREIRNTKEIDGRIEIETRDTTFMVGKKEKVVIVLY